MGKIVLIGFWIFLNCVSSKAQDSTKLDANKRQNDTTKKTIIIQLKKDSRLKDKISVNDSITLLVEYIYGRDSLAFPIIEFHKAKLMANKSYVSIQLPDSVLKNSKYIKIKEQVLVACSRCPASVFEAETILSETIKTFDFKFITNPPGADLYLIPIRECEKYFHTNNYNQIQITPSILPNIDDAKIQVQQTPLTFSVIQESYLAVFALKVGNQGEIKVKKALIKPNRGNAAINQANIIF